MIISTHEAFCSICAGRQRSNNIYPVQSKTASSQTVDRRMRDIKYWQYYESIYCIHTYVRENGPSGTRYGETQTRRWNTWTSHRPARPPTPLGYL